MLLCMVKIYWMVCSSFVSYFVYSLCSEVKALVVCTLRGLFHRIEFMAASFTGRRHWHFMDMVVDSHITGCVQLPHCLKHLILKIWIRKSYLLHVKLCRLIITYEIFARYGVGYILIILLIPWYYFSIKYLAICW